MALHLHQAGVEVAPVHVHTEGPGQQPGRHPAQLAHTPRHLLLQGAPEPLQPSNV